MNDESAFLEAIRANPADDLPRLIFADWLDDHARTDLGVATAEFIRLTCGRARKDGKPYQMLPTGAGKWLKENWRRLVPTLTENWTDGDVENHEHWENQTALRVRVPYPLPNWERTIVVYRPIVWLYFARGFVSLARWHARNIGKGKIAPALARDQPLAEQVGPGAVPTRVSHVTQ
jgi:uncharacterized protein (TIGR02996 family)